MPRVVDFWPPFIKTNFLSFLILSVALSCTLNLSGPDIASYFPKEVLTAAEDALPYSNKAGKVVKMMKLALNIFMASGMNVDTLLKAIIRAKGDIVNERNSLAGKITDIIEYL